MKVIEYTHEDDYDFRQYLDITVNTQDKELCFSFYDGEPEDNNLSRNFSDCYNIVDAMKLAWEAGKRGEEFVLEKGNFDD